MKATFRTLVRTVLVASVIAGITACSEKFKPETFTSEDGSLVLRTVSPTQMDIGWEGAFIPATYSETGDSLRVDLQGRILYLKKSAEGLVDQEGTKFLNEKSYFKRQKELAKEEEARRIAEEQAKLPVKAAEEVLSNARSLHLACHFAFLDSRRQGENNGEGEWPTEVGTTEELKANLLKGAYIESANEFKTLAEHLVIFPISEADSGDTVFAVSDNFYDSGSGKLKGDYFVVLTKELAGGVYPFSEREKISQHMQFLPKPLKNNHD